MRMIHHERMSARYTWHEIALVVALSLALLLAAGRVLGFTW